MSERSDHKWHEFLTTPLPLDRRFGNADELAEQGSVQLRSILWSAVNTGVLPQNCTLAQFVHVRPIEFDVDFEIPTAVAADRLPQLLFASAIQGSFVMKHRTSFFRNCLRLVERNSRGMICTVSGENTHSIALAHAEHSHVVLRGTRVLSPTDDFAETIGNVQREDMGRQPWVYVRGEDIAGIFEIGELQFIKEGDVAAEVPDLVRGILRGHADSYFEHLAPLAALGTVVLCVPAIYSKSGEDNEDGETGGGGVMYVLDGPVSEADLERLYTLAHRMCSVVSGVWDTVKLATTQAWVNAENALSHELPSLIDSVRKYATGRDLLTLNYFKIYELVLGHKYTSSWPDDLAASFTPMGLAQTTLFMAYPRAKNRNWIPNDETGELWSDEALWKASEQWVDYRFTFPDWLSPDHLHGRFSVPSSCYIAFWVYFFLITAQMHSLSYAFPIGVRDTWDGTPLDDERALIEVRFIAGDKQWTIEISDRGAEDIAPPDVVRTTSSMIVARHDDCRIDHLRVRLQEFLYEPDYDDEGRWVARIIGSEERT